MWIKICGIRDVETAEQIAALKPDAIGLNFYAPSPRCVTEETAREIAARMPPTVACVGVFVNHAAEEIVRLVRDCRLTMVQLHGDEPPEFLAGLQSQIPHIPILRAWRMDANLADLRVYLLECDRLRVRLAGCLIDAKVTGSYGGSGQSPPWDVLRTEYQQNSWPKLILAGGLHPENVAAGIAAVEPWGVDVASGVESSPGVQDIDKVRRFIDQAR